MCHCVELKGAQLEILEVRGVVKNDPRRGRGLHGDEYERTNDLGNFYLE